MQLPGLIAAFALVMGAPAGASCASAEAGFALERPREGAPRPHVPVDTLELPSHSLLSLGRRSEPLPAVLVVAVRVTCTFRNSLTVPASTAVEAAEPLPWSSRGPPAS